MTAVLSRGSALREHSGRLAGFALLPALSMLAPLVLLPVVSSRFGAPGWGALAIGQSVGAVLSFVLGMVWPITGGHHVAAAPDATARRRIFRLSMATRGCLLVALLPVGAVVTAALAPGFRIEAVLFMAAVTLNGFTAAWFFAGMGTPRAVVVNEGVVRCCGYLVAVAGLLLGLGLWWYAVAMVLGGLAMTAANWETVMRGGERLAPLRRAEVLGELRLQARPTASRGLQSVFYYGGVTIVALVAPPALAVFAAADQVQKAANNGLAVLPVAFVGWVGRGGAEVLRRGRHAFLVVAAFASTCAVLLGLLGQTVFALLFAGRVQLDPVVVWALGVVILVFVLSRSAELLLLVPAGMADAVWRSNRVASPVGLVLVAVGALTGGVLGALLATLLAELGALVYYLSVRARTTRSAVR